MSTPQDDNQPVVWAVLVAVIVLAIGLAVGFGIAKSKKAAPAAPAAAVARVDPVRGYRCSCDAVDHQHRARHLGNHRNAAAGWNRCYQRDRAD